MQIQSTSPVSTFAENTAPSGSTTGTSTGSSGTSTNPLGTPSESEFLQLLVAQMKYQDPTSPTDPTQFVSELAQFSQLESTLNIQQNTSTLVQDFSGATTAPTTPTPATTPTTTQSPATNAA
jgi:flagellar basal-body rod modification protein FlgD